MRNITDRFLGKIKKTSGCWLWEAELTGNGYGRIWDGTKKIQATHASLFLFKGIKLGPGQQANHACDTPACVNPDHLWVGTQSENVLDAHRKGRKTNPTPFRGIKECKRGHRFTEANTYHVIKRGARQCRKCTNRRMRLARAAKRAAHLGVVFVVLLAGCASLPAETIPSLENRTLKISDKVPGFEYQWQECVKKSLFGDCKKYEAKVEYYDLTDIATREKLMNMGFVAKVKEKLGP